jgi:hypothetical protein
LIALAFDFGAGQVFDASEGDAVPDNGIWNFLGPAQVAQGLGGGAFWDALTDEQKRYLMNAAEGLLLWNALLGLPTDRDEGDFLTERWMGHLLAVKQEMYNYYNDNLTALKDTTPPEYDMSEETKLVLNELCYRFFGKPFYEMTAVEQAAAIATLKQTGIIEIAPEVIVDGLLVQRPQVLLYEGFPYPIPAFATPPPPPLSYDDERSPVSSMIR